jgi:hypothetical protein
MSTAGGTRAARAATSKKVKQELVHFLFKEQYIQTGPEKHRLLDYSMYSYNDLRKAYLERLQVIHPDKQRSNAYDNNNHNVQSKENNSNSNIESKTEFQILQELWSKYDEMAKSMMKVSGGDGEAANFTLFGVGCSFSDNEQERALRDEITDQACRGWFSSGLLGENNNEGTSRSKSKKDSIFTKQNHTSLVDDSLFVETTSLSREDKAQTNRKKSARAMSTLIPGWKRK